MAVIGDRRTVWDVLRSATSIILTSHVRPDGDGIASEMALSSIMMKLGKKVAVINQDVTPEIYTWLPGTGSIIQLNSGNGNDGGIPDGREYDLAVLLDCSDPSRIGGVYDIIKKAKKIISIDHHMTTDPLGADSYIDTDASSIGEIIYNLVPEIDALLDRDIATCIYTSIMTDTGSFAYSNTTAEVFRIISRMMDFGADPSHCNSMVYNNRRLEHFRLLGLVLQLMELDGTGTILYVILPRDVYNQTGARDEDNEGILEILKGLRKIELIIMLRQLDDERLKCSLRAMGGVDCNHLAKMYGGGGHLKASGFIIDGDVSTRGPSIVKRIVEEVKVNGWL